MKSTAFSLGEIAHRRVLDEMLSIGSADVELGSVAGKVFVLDAHTLKIVSSVCKRSELTERGALFIEQIERPRQPFPDLDVVYFLTATAEMVDYLLCDQTDSSPYRYSYVYFTSSLEPRLFDKLIGSSQFVSRCKNLVEFNLDFVVFEPNVFHSDAPKTLNSLRNDADTSLVQSHIDCLLSVCASLKERPVLRFFDKSICSSISQRIALGLRRQLDALAKSSPALLKPNGTTLLILDRSIESSGLLVHDFFYQALALDVLDGVEPTGVQWALGINSGELAGEQATSVNPSFVYSAVLGKGGVENRRVILGESDPLWAKFRHEHFRIVSEKISKEVAGLVRSTEAARSGGSKDPLELLRGIPELQDQLAKLSVHLEMSKTLVSVFDKLCLMDVARIEQELLTGLDDEGKEVSCTKIYTALLALLSDRKTIGPEERLRLIMLYLSQVHDVSEITAQELVKTVGCLDANFEAAVSNFLALGIHGTRVGETSTQQLALITVPSNRHTLKLSKSKLKRNKHVTRNAKFVNCRFQSELRDVVEKTLQNSLDVVSFPNVGGTGISTYIPGGVSPDGPRVSAASQWGAAAQDPALATQQKLIVFVVGGITLTETREMAELSQLLGIEILLGGSTILTPKRLVEILLT